MQENVAQTDAVVLREGTVRLDNLPLVARVPSLPELPPGARVTVEVGDIDLLDKTLACTWLATLEAPAPGEAVEAEAEIVQASPWRQAQYQSPGRIPVCGTAYSTPRPDASRVK